MGVVMKKGLVSPGAGEKRDGTRVGVCVCVGVVTTDAVGVSSKRRSDEERRRACTPAGARHGTETGRRSRLIANMGE